MLPVYNGPFTHRTLRCASKTPETFYQRSEATRAPRMCERPLTPYNLQVAVAERLARLTALSEDQGSNRKAGGVAFTATAAAIFSVGYGVCTLTAAPRSTQSSTVRGTVK